MRIDNFGKLVRALRKERIDFETGQPWTRRKLAAETGITYDTLGNLETGRKSGLQQDELIALANAFQLSTGERRAFINAANGVDTKFMVSEQNTPESIFEHCRQVMETIHCPALLINPFYDLIGANMAAIYFFNLQDSDYLDWKNQTYPKNILSVLFDPELLQSPIIGKDYREFIVRNVMNYRIRSLPHRYKPYVQEQLVRFQKLNPIFQSLWMETQHIDEDVFLGLPFTVNTQKWGPLRVIGSTLPFTTEFGNVEVIVESPADESTRDIFSDLIKFAGQGFIKLYDWPEKPTD